MAISGTTPASRSHEEDSNPPSRNPMIVRRAAPDRYIAIASPAARSDPTAYPVSSRLVSGDSPPIRDSRYTAVTAMRAPAKASTWTSPNPTITNRTGMRTAIAAPSAAPDAVPST